MDDAGSRNTAPTAPRGGAAAPTQVDGLQHWLRVRWRWVRKHARLGVIELGKSIKHWEVWREIEADGRLTGRYLFMVVMSCAIAILGLLLSSPAVVIGAMLISPLMGPIMLLGFSLCALDYSGMRRALVSIGAGVLGSLAIAILIVALSPLREATSEILARTRPNLFDLLVAIFSGLAGGYSVIHRKGATIVGVAIATALMPPLAVMGFGIATGSVVIAGGAFFLFMTNLLAIALTVTGLAWLHGFATVHSEKAMRWQSLLVIGVFVALSLPLGFALRDIAYEARVQNIVRESALEPFEDTAEVASLTVTFPRNELVHIQQTVLTHTRIADAERRLAAHYERVLGSPVQVQLNQVLVDQDRPIDAATVRRMAESSLLPLQKQIEALSRTQTAAEDVRNAVPFPTLAMDIDAEALRAVIVAAPSRAMTLAGYRESEAALLARLGDWDITVTPPMSDVPAVMFDGVEISTTGRETLNDIIWAMRRWGVSEAEVVGQASLGGASTATNRRVALQRAEAVAVVLKAEGFAVTTTQNYGAADQAAQEREFGKARFQSALVQPLRPTLH